MSGHLDSPIEVRSLRSRDNRSARKRNAIVCCFALKTCDSCRQHTQESTLVEQGLEPPEEKMLRAIFGDRGKSEPRPNVGKFFCEACVQPPDPSLGVRRRRRPRQPARRSRADNA